jgi:hypothetical protein
MADHPSALKSTLQSVVFPVAHDSSNDNTEKHTQYEENV